MEIEYKCDVMMKGRKVKEWKTTFMCFGMPLPFYI